ncbi:hypothetical protein Tco_0876654 [Tanacetum coccineum]|uniref:Uncharacterized protein n=1 Tax=Tanacetum coccineum TaxID=301880 RepID=A0ABQ5BUG4_9ASTR
MSDDECIKLLTNKVDLYNPEGHQIQRNVYEPLPLGGPPGQRERERRIALSISKLKAARYLDFGLEELVPTLWVEKVEREYASAGWFYGITHGGFLKKGILHQQTQIWFPLILNIQEKLSHSAQDRQAQSSQRQSNEDTKPGASGNRVEPLQARD